MSQTTPQQPEIKAPQGRLEHARKAVEHAAQTAELDTEGEICFSEVREAYGNYMQEIGDEKMVERRPDVEEGLEIAAERLESLKNNWGINGEYYDEFGQEDEAVEALEDFVDHYDKLLDQFEQDSEEKLEDLYGGEEPDFPPTEDQRLF